MIRYFLFLISIFLLFNINTAAAQDNAPYVKFSGGFVINDQPQDFSDFWSMGWQGRTAYGVPLTLLVSAEFEVGFHHFSFDEGAFLEALGVEPGLFAIESGAIQIYTAFLNGVVHYADEGAFRPFLKAGGGLFVTREDDLFIVDGNDESFALFGEDLVDYSFGFQLLGGFDYYLNNRTAIFLHAGIMQGYPGGDLIRTYPVNIGVKLAVN